MTVSTHKATAKGSGGVDDGKNSGTVLNGGNISGSLFQAKSLIDINTGTRSNRGTGQVQSNTGTAYEVGITTANSSGTLAYNPSSPAVTRSSTNTGFLIRGGSPTLLAGRASTGDILAIPGSDAGTRRSIHFTESRYQKGTWATSVFNLFRNPTAASTNNHGLLQDDGTAKSGITSRGSVQKHNAIDNENNNIDNAARPTRAIPGEFVILQNFVSYTGTSTSGDGTSSETLMDYSALTG